MAAFHQINPTTGQERERETTGATTFGAALVIQQMQNLTLGATSRSADTTAADNDLALLPILLANSRASNQTPLYDPTQAGVLLTAPNPPARNELHNFSGNSPLLLFFS